MAPDDTEDESSSEDEDSQRFFGALADSEHGGDLRLLAVSSSATSPAQASRALAPSSETALELVQLSSQVVPAMSALGGLARPQRALPELLVRPSCTLEGGVQTVRRGVVRHRVLVQKTWKAGDRVLVRLSGAELECVVPEHLKKGDAFYVRVARDRLPPLLVHSPHDFDDPFATLWRRDLERLNSLVQCDEPEARCRAKQLARALLAAPLRDSREYQPVANTSRDANNSPRGVSAGSPNSLDAPPPETPSSLEGGSHDDDDDYGVRRRRRGRGATQLPRARYRGSLDEDAAQRWAVHADEQPFVDDTVDGDARLTAAWSGEHLETRAERRRTAPRFALLCARARRDAQDPRQDSRLMDWREESFLQRRLCLSTFF